MPQIFDLNNALVYYVSDVFPERRKNPLPDYLSVIDSSGIELDLKDPTYDPDPRRNPTLAFEPDLFLLDEIDNTKGGRDVVRTLSYTVTESSSLSVSFTEGVTIGAETTLTTKIPFIAEGSIKLSAEAAFASTQTQTSEISKTVGATATITASPRTRLMAMLQVNNRPYQGRLTTKVFLSGHILINSGGNFRKSIFEVFSQIKRKPPGFFALRDDQATYQFTNDDLARFQIDPTTQRVYYEATADVQAKYFVSSKLVVVSVPPLSVPSGPGPAALRPATPVAALTSSASATPTQDRQEDRT